MKSEADLYHAKMMMLVKAPQLGFTADPGYRGALGLGEDKAQPQGSKLIVRSWTGGYEDVPLDNGLEELHDMYLDLLYGRDHMYSRSWHTYLEHLLTLPIIDCFHRHGFQGGAFVSYKHFARALCALRGFAHGRPDASDEEKQATREFSLQVRCSDRAMVGSTEIKAGDWVLVSRMYEGKMWFVKVAGFFEHQGPGDGQPHIFLKVRCLKLKLEVEKSYLAMKHPNPPNPMGRPPNPVPSAVHHRRAVA